MTSISDTKGVTTFGKDGSTIKVEKTSATTARITLTNSNEPWTARSIRINKTDATVIAVFLADFTSS